MHRIVLLPVFVLLAATVVVADDNRPASDPAARKMAQADKEADKSKANRPKTPPIDEKAEADVLEFVSEHHPELADLLEQLRDKNSKEYQKAISDLSRVRQRLHLMQKNDDQRYKLELAIWKAETHIQLLAARLHMDDKAELRDQLRAALSEQVDLRLQLLKYEREIAKDRLSRIESQIKKLDSERSQTIDRQLQVLTAKSKATAPEKAPAKSAAQTDKTKPVSKPAKDKPAKAK